MRVFVLDNQKQPLMPCLPARARQLLRAGKAAVFRRHPFIIILKERSGGKTQPVSLNIDPGSKITGIALVAQYQQGATAILGIHLQHRGHRIKKLLESRRAIRRSRRHRKTRYRPARFLNRKKNPGWLPPSLMSRVYNVETWAKQLKQFAPISEANVETVRFDLQLLENPDIQGVDYQRGTLFGSELREYLLQRHRHTCSYCQGLSKDNVLNIEHVLPKALGGANRLSNLVIACRTCNEAKGAIHPAAWQQQCAPRKHRLDQCRAKSIANILKGVRPALRDAAAVNATRYATGRNVQQLIPNTQFWSGGRTKKNRTDQGFAKDHWIDAACLGTLGQKVFLEPKVVLMVKAQGHGSRQMCRMDRYGFPRTTAKSQRSVCGFKTGDIVKAVVPHGKKAGTYTGRVAIRSSGSFNITGATVTQGISYKYCTKCHAADGYGYHLTTIAYNHRRVGEKAA